MAFQVIEGKEGETNGYTWRTYITGGNAARRNTISGPRGPGLMACNRWCPLVGCSAHFACHKAEEGIHYDSKPRPMFPRVPDIFPIAAKAILIWTDSGPIYTEVYPQRQPIAQRMSMIYMQVIRMTDTETERHEHNNDNYATNLRLHPSASFVTLPASLLPYAFLPSWLHS